jgi:anti-sigma factor RsiW
MTHDDSWAKLDVYLDGALAAGERWAVAVHLNECAECRQYVAEQARLREIVRDHVASVAVPPGLDERLRAALAAEENTVPLPEPVALPSRRMPRMATLLGPIAAGLLLLIWAFAASQTLTPGPNLPLEVIAAHLVFAQDTSKLDVAGNAATVESWFRDEAGLSVSVPDIEGYGLSGARLIVVHGQPAAQVVYRSEPDGIYLSLLRFKDREQEANLAGAEERDGYAVGQQGITSLVTWATGDDRNVLVGEVPEAELRRIADDLAKRLPVLPTVAPLRPRPIPSGEDDQMPSRYME